MCRAQNDPSGPAYQCKDKASVAAAAHAEVVAYIGATPVRPESARFISVDNRGTYFSSHEWREFDDHVAISAARHGVELIETKTAAGLWQGKSEPSGAYIASGTEQNIRSWAAELAGRYHQDAVMVAMVDPDGPDRLYSFPVGEQDPADDVRALKAAGLKAGTLAGGQLQVLSAGELTPHARWALQMRQTVGISTYQPVRVAFIEGQDTGRDHSPVKEIQALRQRYAAEHGLPERGPLPHLSEADDIAAAQAYEHAVHDPSDRTVRRSYAALREHVLAQHQMLLAAGYRFEPWHGQAEQPYADSADMLTDLRENKHLFYYRTEVSDTTEGALQPGHPMAGLVQMPDEQGGTRTAPVNDAFRCVHDTIAHSDGVQFGPVGERRAWWAHRSCLPPAAHLALFNETRGQNAWTNFGPHMRHPTEPRGLRPHEPGWMPIPDRPYAEQKACRIPKGLY